MTPAALRCISRISFQREIPVRPRFGVEAEAAVEAKGREVVVSHAQRERQPCRFRFGRPLAKQGRADSATSECGQELDVDQTDFVVLAPQDAGADVVPGGDDYGRFGIEEACRVVGLAGAKLCADKLVALGVAPARARELFGASGGVEPKKKRGVRRRNGAQDERRRSVDGGRFHGGSRFFAGRSPRRNPQIRRTAAARSFFAGISAAIFTANTNSNPHTHV